VIHSANPSSAAADVQHAVQPQVSSRRTQALGARVVPIVGAAAALALGWWAEVRTEASDPSWIPVLLFVASIGAFAWSERPLGPAAADLPENDLVGPATAGGWRKWLVLIAGVATALALEFEALQLLRGRWASVPGTAMWGAGIAFIAFTGVLLGRWKEWPARWGVRVWPRTQAGRALLWVTLAAILCLAATGRLLWLDQVPRGINPDEGDRAATSIQIIRGTIHNGVFDYGWYFISMVYFWILAQVMQVTGISFVGARILGALSGIVTVATVMWIGVRHFGYRVGVLAGGLLAVLGIALQFARETTEATPTAMLWTLSAAAFLEAARRGRSAAWVVAGLTGGFSIYFYPTGRMWAALATLFCVYLLVHGLGGRRWHILRGAALAAVASLVITAPYLLRASENNWDTFTVRARQTSIFVNDNFTRLTYYRHGWSMLRLLREQVQRSIGILNRYSDRNGFWPTNRPLMSGVLAMLTMIGLGWIYLRPRDPRFVLLAIWYAVGIAGVIVTVETPNVQRMATAIPVLAFLPALLLDNVARRVEAVVPLRAPRAQRLIPATTTVVVIGVMALLMFREWKFYFVTYGNMDEWSGPTLLGTTVRDQGEDTDVFTMGRQAHIVNQGWVRLLAPDTPRGGLQFPGSELPVAIESNNNLTIMVTPQQPHYLPYLRDLYPGGTATPVFDRNQPLCTMYRIPKEQRLAALGALVTPPDAKPVRVEHVGEAPLGWSVYPSPMRWTAMWRVPQYWNYALRIGPGPARLTIDGVEVLTVPAGDDMRSTEVALAQGDHFVEYEGTLAAPGKSAVLEQSIVWRPTAHQATPQLTWRPIERAGLRPAQDGPDGLFGVVTSPGRPEQHRLDGTLATGSLSAQTRIDGHPYTTTWTGTLHAPVSGTYGMGLFTQGKVELRIDGQSVLHSDEGHDEPIVGKVDLQAGPHAVEVVYEINGGPSALEWTWEPPGRPRSIVPRSALTPPPGAGVGPRLSFDVLGPQEQMPREQRIEVAK
jgi:Dolichyl-phosphate-mannose-protein mannosyltransferase/PA14 domain